MTCLKGIYFSPDNIIFMPEFLKQQSNQSTKLTPHVLYIINVAFTRFLHFRFDQALLSYAQFSHHKIILTKSTLGSRKTLCEMKGWKQRCRPQPPATHAIEMASRGLARWRRLKLENATPLFADPRFPLSTDLQRGKIFQRQPNKNLLSNLFF